MLSHPLISKPTTRSKMPASLTTDRGQLGLLFPPRAGSAFFRSDLPQSSLIASNLSERPLTVKHAPEISCSDCAPHTLAHSDEFAHDHPDHASCVIADGDEDDGLPLDLLHPRFGLQSQFHLGLDHRE